MLMASLAAGELVFKQNPEEILSKPHPVTIGVGVVSIGISTSKLASET
jgi:hypothetical protein